MPADHSDEVTPAESENERLEVSLRRCRALIAECRSKLAANANDDYRPPYPSEDGGEGHIRATHRGE